jgi:type IV pilus assembly protein PilM
MSALSFVQRVFPPPAFMSFNCVGVDISDTSLKFIEFERKRTHDTHLHLKHWGDLEIPSGVVDRGNVHDGTQLAKVLAEVKAQTGTDYVNISLPEERAYLFETTVAIDTPQKDIRSLLEFRLEENVPLSPRDAYFDYVIVGEDEPHRMLRVVVAVYAQGTINSYYEACKAASLIPISFEIEAQAIARASIPQSYKHTSLIVDFGKTRMGIGIVHQGVLMYTSTTEIAGEQISQDLRGILGNVAESELTEIKNTRGLMRTKENEKLADIFEKYAENIVDELSIRMHYWNTRGIETEEREIKKIILCGGSANLFGLPEFLSRRLSVPTERAHVWDNAFSLQRFVPPITRRYSYGYATAIGLALRNFTQL